MRLLFDTNVLLDVLLKREEFYLDSLESIKKALDRGDKIYVSSSAITDIYYIVRKNSLDKTEALEIIKNIAKLFRFAEVNEQVIYSAINSKMSDFEDAVVDSVGQNISANYIITRNKLDFKCSIIPAINPKEYLKIGDSLQV